MTRSRYRYRFVNDYLPHFMTNTVVAWLPVFSNPDDAAVVLDSGQFLQRQRGIEILGWVIMENHLHWIALGPELGKRVGEFKSFTATSLIKLMNTKGNQTMLQELGFYKLRHKVDQEHQFWQEGSHPQAIECAEVLWQKLDYIHNNPLRRGYVDDPLHWRYSSARAYAGLPGLIDVCTDWR